MKKKSEKHFINFVILFFNKKKFELLYEGNLYDCNDFIRKIINDNGYFLRDGKWIQKDTNGMISKKFFNIKSGIVKMPHAPLSFYLRITEKKYNELYKK